MKRETGLDNKKSYRRIGIYRNFIKRPMDIIFSFSAIIILSPLLAVIAFLVKTRLGSPVLFKQNRPGLNGEIFTIYKFRTMTDEKDENGELLPDSIRLTKFGKILRSTSLDEIPELYNILKGEMSFVGPRPLSVKYLPYYNETERQRHDVRPGLTGLAQVNGRNKVTWEQRFSMDIDYVNNLSFIQDVKITLKTIVVVLGGNDVVVRGTGDVQDFHKYRIKQSKKKELK